MAEQTEELEQVTDAPTQEEVTEARSLGWKPLQEWKGDQTKHLDVRPYLERARGVLPIVNATNERLRDELAAERNARAEQDRRLRANEAALAALQEESADSAQTSYETTKTELKARIAAASRDGDHEGLAEATEALADLRPPEKKEEAPAAKTGLDSLPPEARTLMQNEILPWFEQNPAYRFGPEAGLANHFSSQLLAKGTPLKGAAFLDAVKQEVEAYLGGTPAAGRSRVSGGNGGAGRTEARTSNEKTYADLPADAKQFCDNFAKRVVGEGKKHKTVDSWRKSYTNQYFSGAQQ